ncbi:MAG: phosphate signaling complex protein PhoU [Actinobacteria bacterium]|nr:phosphate signaling complex protein PhoU [Actinomycetota bacterium]MCB0920744.1 phosphate signaling complex protein PhoU [Actinomycetota bacterium]MCB8997437.1 phosphate signaling complex protein PhoU [Actinomycetota bacterium]
MRTAFNARLATIDDQVLAMARHVRTAMHAATKALLETDLHLAESVITDDADLDNRAHEVEESVYRLLAQQQPVAQDLRFLLAALHNASALERMGDLVMHIAKTARMRYPMAVVPTELRGIIVDMGTVASQMVANTAVALARQDLTTARSLRDMDREMDRLHRELFIIVLSPAWEYGVQAAVDITLLSRYFERFADHAVTIGDRVVHVATGASTEPVVPRQVNGPVNPR